MKRETPLQAPTRGALTATDVALPKMMVWRLPWRQLASPG